MLMRIVVWIAASSVMLGCAQAMVAPPDSGPFADGGPDAGVDAGPNLSCFATSIPLSLSWDGGIARATSVGEYRSFTLDTVLDCDHGPNFRHGSAHLLELDRAARIEAHAALPDGGIPNHGLIWLERACTGIQLECGMPTLSTSAIAPGKYLVRIASYEVGPGILELGLTESLDGG